MYVNDAKTSGVIFNYLVNNRYGEGSRFPIKLKGLDPAKQYAITELNVYPRNHKRDRCRKNLFR